MSDGPRDADPPTWTDRAPTQDPPGDGGDRVEGTSSEAAAPSRPEPVGTAERVRSVDVLRGVAVLGILTMNIVSFGWPMAGYDNPLYSGGDHLANRAAWWLNTLVFSGKMMSLFAMLFGAGLVLMDGRAEARGVRIRGVYYRRVLWLLIFGLVHAYLIWAGDILYTYAVCGLFLFAFRHRSPRALIAIGVALVAVGLLMTVGFLGLAGYVEQVADQVEALHAGGRTPEDWQVELHRTWTEELRSYFQPDAEDLAREIAIYRDGYPGIVRDRATEVFFLQTILLVLILIWDAGGRMLLGMGLMKLGVFSAGRSSRFYVRMAVLGYGIGLPLSILGAADLMAAGFAPTRAVGGSLALGLGMVPTALGHAAMVMLMCRSGAFPGLTSRLAAVGRMALTNYLMQSVLCTSLFYGYGLGQFARIGRPGLWGVVLAIWLFQLWLSPLWLARFRYGPAEWLWRSLTYGRPQRFRVPESPT